MRQEGIRCVNNPSHLIDFATPDTVYSGHSVLNLVRTTYCQSPEGTFTQQETRLIIQLGKFSLPGEYDASVPPSSILSFLHSVSIHPYRPQTDVLHKPFLHCPGFCQPLNLDEV